MHVTTPLTNPSKVVETTFATSNSTTYVRTSVLKVSYEVGEVPATSKISLLCASNAMAYGTLVPVWEFYYVLRRGLEHCNYRHEWQRLMKTLRHVETGTLLYMGILHGQPFSLQLSHNGHSEGLRVLQKPCM